MSILERLAGAPISWGVCEVPGWGLALPAERVLREMSEVGIVALEMGPEGFLPSDPSELSDLVSAHHLQLIGGFVPLVLHDPAQAEETIIAARRNARLLSAAGATEFITAMVASFDWAPRHDLDESGWSHTAKMLRVVDEIASENGLTQSLHPHLGTMIEQPDDIHQVLDRTEVEWCFDTGHLAIPGYDPLEFVADAGERIRHVHLKDAVLELAGPVVAGEKSIMEGVQDGMFCPMGRGDVPISEIIIELERSGYDRWYVLEQDTALTLGEPPEGHGPRLDVQMSVDYIRGIDAVLETALKSSQVTSQ